MNKHIFTIGLNDRDAEVQIISTDTAIDLIADTLINDHGVFAFTMSECKGVYKMNSTNNIVKENSIRVEIVTESDEDIDAVGIMFDLKVRLNQESIMHEVDRRAMVTFF